MSKAMIPSKIKSYLTKTCENYAETIREQGVPNYGTPVVTHIYDEPPYSPMREYGFAFSDFRYYYKPSKQNYTLEEHISILGYVLDFAADSRFIDLSLLDLIVKEIEKKPPSQVQETIKSVPQLQAGIVNFLLKDALLEAKMPKLKREESKSLLNHQREKFMPMVKRLWPYVSELELNLVLKPLSLTTVFNGLSDEVRNFLKEKKLESKPQELTIFPSFTNSTQALIFIRGQYSQVAKNIPDKERGECLHHFASKIENKEIKHDSDSIRYLTLLGACHKQLVCMVSDSKLKNPEKIKLMTGFGAKLDLFYKNLAEKGVIESARLFDEIIKVRLSLKEMQKSNVRSRSTAEELFDKYFGDNFLRFYKLDYFGKQGENILNHVDPLKISKLTQEVADEKQLSLDSVLEQTTQLQELKISDSHFENTNENKDKGKINDEDEDPILIEDEKGIRQLQIINERITGLELSIQKKEKDHSSDLSYLSIILQNVKWDNSALAGKIYVKASALEATYDSAESNKIRRNDVLNLVAKLFGFKKGFHSTSTTEGINAEKLSVLNRLIKFDYDEKGHLMDQGVKQLANFVMLEIIKDNKSFVLFKKNTYQIFKDHVGTQSKFTKVLEEVGALHKIYLKEKSTADKRTDPINYLRTVQSQSQTSQTASLV